MQLRLLEKKEIKDLKGMKDAVEMKRRLRKEAEKRFEEILMEVWGKDIPQKNKKMDLRIN